MSELLTYCRRLRRYVARLQTSLQLAEAAEAEVGGSNGFGFEPEAYVAFRDAGVFELALEMAEVERFGALSVLFEAHKEELGPVRLRVLSAVPETTSPASYSDLVTNVVEEVLEEEEERLEAERAKAEAGETEEEAAGGGEEEEEGEGSEEGEGKRGADRSNRSSDEEEEEDDEEDDEEEDDDEAEMELAAAIGVAGEQPSSRHASSPSTTRRGAGSPPVRPERPLDRAALVSWFCFRAGEIDERSGQLDNSLSLLELGARCGLERELSALIRRAKQLCLLVYDLGCEMRLPAFEALTPSERLRLCFELCPTPTRARGSGLGGDALVLHGGAKGGGGGRRGRHAGQLAGRRQRPRLRRIARFMLLTLFRGRRRHWGRLPSRRGRPRVFAGRRR